MYAHVQVYPSKLVQVFLLLKEDISIVFPGLYTYIALFLKLYLPLNVNNTIFKTLSFKKVNDSSIL